MQIKHLFITITVLFSLLLPGLAQAQQQKLPLLRLIYFLPRDRQPEPDINNKMDRVIKQVQQHYADEMERLGYGKKTFKLEIGANGKVAVHHVKGSSNDSHYRFNTFQKIADEISKRYDTSKDVYFVAVNTATGFDSGVPGRELVCGLGGHFTLVRSVDACFTTDYGFLVAAHELGHTFGLQHDFRNDTFLMSYGGGTNLSPCDAEWLDVHRAFNASQPAANKRPTIEMFPPSLAAPPNAIRFRFKIADPEGLHQARLHTKTIAGLAVGFPEVVSCKRLNGNPSTTAELITTHLGADNKSVSLQVIDTNGNFTMSKEFSVNIASLLPRARTVSIPDANLAAAIRQEIGSSITTHTILNLTRLDARNRGIKNLTGLEHAQHLKQLNLSWEYINARGLVNSNNISNLSPLANLTQLTRLYLSKNSISNISTLSKMTQLVHLDLSDNTISDISTLSKMTQLDWLDLSNNTISNVSPLSGLKQLTGLHLYDNDISDVSPLAGMTQLVQLHLSDNAISDVSPLSDLRQLVRLLLVNNSISDISPLVNLDLPGTQQDNTGLYLWGNPLNYASINTHIPTMQAKGTIVKFDNRTPTTLVKISGDAQQGTANTALQLPFSVEVRDERNRPFAGVPVTFSIPAGNGKLSNTRTTTDTTGKASARLTLGATAGATQIRVSAAKISQPVHFIVKTVLLNTPVAIPDASLRAKIAETLGKPRSEPLTASDMHKLKLLRANDANIHDLTGLEHAVNLITLSLNNNSLSDITPLAGLFKLITLSLNNNHIQDLTPLTGLSHLETLSLNNNNLSDAALFTELTQLKSLNLQGNLLNYPSLYTHIRTLQSRGVRVAFSSRTPTTLVKISGTRGIAGATLLLTVEVQDENGIGFSGVPVTFAVTAGSGRLSQSNAITDETGKARTTLTLGATQGNNAVRATTAKAQQLALFTITAVNANSTVTVPDANLRAKVAETLGKPLNAQLTAGDMLRLTRLEAPNANIRNLAGLEQAHNLASLNLGGAYVSEKGYVNSNTIRDFSPILELTQLNSLNLTFSSLSDVSFLSELTQLKWLDLGNNNLFDISVLTELTQLTFLYLSSNPITDAAPLAGLTQLTHLDLSSTSISDMSPLAELTQLRALYLYSISFTDISSLSRLKQLTNLSISGTSISDVSALAELTQLTSLYLVNISISDVSALTELTQLTYLNLYSNSISDVSALARLTQLTFLYLGNNRISDVSPLAKLTQLKVLNLSHNSIADVSPLVGLNLTGTEWSTTGLNVIQNPLSHASVHTHIPAMQVKGINIVFGHLTHPVLLKISGDDQEDEVGTILANPFVVEAQDKNGSPMVGIDITFTGTTGGGTQGGILAPIITTDANGRAQTTLTLGQSPGTNKVTATARGLPEVTFTATATASSNPKIAGEVANDQAEDVNKDGVVDIQDFEAVAAALGEQGENDADVNEDGFVDTADLVLVIGVLESLASAPSLQTQFASRFTAAEIQHWLIQAHHLDRTVPAYRRGIVVLEYLLTLLLPKETALLANYPNPFNPETWIPYQLAAPAEVTLHIYAVNGTLVQTLALGHQAAGMYQNRSRAAYWDGCNSLGEPVASGIYFYTLTTNYFTATRKMLIRK